MSSLYKHPAPINSDESNSTEHDATVSLSGTDEFNDTHSVFSDTGSKASKLNDPRKAIHRLNKLKEENAMLKESLEKANASDITMLKSKLRGSHADLVRMRQNNSELKDRIQILESRLFTALSLTGVNSKNNAGASEGGEIDAGKDALTDVLPAHFAEIQQKEKFTSGDRAHLMDMIRSLQSRCKHLARLVQSYETKISVLQSVGDAKQLGSQPVVAHTTHSIEFDMNPPHEVHEVHVDRTNTSTVEWTSNPLKSALKGSNTTNTPQTIDPATTATTSSSTHPTNTNTSNTTTSAKRVKISSSEVESRVQQAREEDQKMIRELSNEVRRLVALLPREKVADPGDELPVSDEGDKDEGEDSGDGGVEESNDKNGIQRTTSASSASRGRVDNSKVANAGANSISADTSVQYTHGDVLCSFFFGVIIMLVCVTLSTYLANQVGAAEAERAES